MTYTPYCPKVMSGCRSCSGRLFHSVGPAVAKQRSPICSLCMPRFMSVPSSHCCLHDRPTCYYE